MVLKLFIIILFVLIFYYVRGFLKFNRNKKIKNVNKLNIFNRKNLNNWMNLSKRERYDLSKQESITYSIKRKVLLEEIRKEYKKISEKKSN